MPEAERVTPPLLWPVVLALGVTQIISYGTLYYSFALVVPLITQDLSATPEVLFGLLSAGFLVGGLISPYTGRLMDEWGAARVMTLGSLVVALLYGVAAYSPSLAVFAFATVAMQFVAVTVEYDAAFAAITQAAGARAQSSITHLTLIAGFASTLFWPLTGWLMAQGGWRATYLAFAGLHLLVAAPLHAWLWSLARKDHRLHASHRPVVMQDSDRADRKSFWMIAVSFALSSALITALGTHLVPLLLAKDLGQAAYSLSMFMGPAQVAIRVTNATVWRNIHPVIAALIAALSLPLSAALLMWPADGVWTAGLLFALLFGVGQGLFSITRGTVPLALFGTQGYGMRLGQLAAVRTVLSAGAPFAFAFVWHRFSLDMALTISIVLGILAALPLMLVRRN